MKSPHAMALLASMSVLSAGCFFNDDGSDPSPAVSGTQDSQLIGTWTSQRPKQRSASDASYLHGAMTFGPNGESNQVQLGMWNSDDTGWDYSALLTPDTVRVGKWVNESSKMLRFEDRVFWGGAPDRILVSYLGYELHGDSLFTWPVAAYAGSGNLVGSKFRIDEEMDSSSTYDSILLTQDGRWINWFYQNNSLASVDTVYFYQRLEDGLLVRWGSRSPMGDTLQISRYERGYLMTHVEDLARRMKEPLIRNR